MTVKALILAGSRKAGRDTLERAAGVDQKALLPILGRPMVTWVLEALQAAPEVTDVAVCAATSKEMTSVLNGIPLMTPGRGPSESVKNALDTFGTPMLITTADHPLLKPEWIATMIRRVKEMDCDFAIAIASREVIERDVPSSNRTFIRLTDHVFSGCNVFFAATPKAKSLVELWQNVERNRKKPWRLALGIGWPVMRDVLLRRLTRERLREHILRLSGAKVCFINIDDGCAAVDVDTPADLILVENLLAVTQRDSADELVC